VGGAASPALVRERVDLGAVAIRVGELQTRRAVLLELELVDPGGSEPLPGGEHVLRGSEPEPEVVGAGEMARRRAR
jgi:hypothetical protein